VPQQIGAYHHCVPTIRAPGRALLIDAATAALLVAASILLGARTFALDPDLQKAIIAFDLRDSWEGQVWLWWIAGLPAIWALLKRRKWPVVAYVVAVGVAAVHRLDPDLGLLPLDLAAPITLYTLASLAAYRRTGLVALAGGLAALCVVVAGGWEFDPIVPGSQPSTTDVPLLDNATTAAIPALLLGMAWALGDNARTRRLHLGTLQQRAADLQRERDHRAKLAVAAERARITRELHDVVAHSMSVMVIQAQAAEAALPPGSDIAGRALTHVIGTGRASLAEMRRLLGIVRAGPDESQPLDPPLGIAALPDLIDQARSSGTPVALQVDGEPAVLPAAVDLSVYRIVQEALTNTRRHAGAGVPATVAVMFRPAHLGIEITDEGTKSTMDGDGHGLRGLVERVVALGGTITTGPRPGGGFGVHALLPLTTDGGAAPR
jgi:signal transduction histidine kinase